MTTPQCHHRGPSRRAVLTVGALAAGAATGAGLVVGGESPASAAPASAAAIQVVFGTPTDIARSRSDTTWARDVDGTVLIFDKAGKFWRVAAQQDWTTVQTFGTAVEARWGQPSGRTASVLVVGNAPVSPTPPASGTPTPSPSPTPTGSGTAPSTTTPGTSSTPAPTTAATGSGSSAPQAAGAKVASSNGGGGKLPATGFDSLRYEIIGGLAVLAGAVLTRFGQRGLRDSAGEDQPLEP